MIGSINSISFQLDDKLLYPLLRNLSTPSIWATTDVFIPGYYDAKALRLSYCTTQFALAVRSHVNGSNIVALTSGDETGMFSIYIIVLMGAIERSSSFFG